MPKQIPVDATLHERIRLALRDIPDFPRPGIVFKDITPLLGDARLFAEVVEAMASPFRAGEISHVAGIESRGFIFGAPVALALGAGLIPIRKPGKLPSATIIRDFALEYGTDRLEIHRDACDAGSRVLLVDDVLATGGTAEAAAALVEQLGGVVSGCAFLLAIEALHGRARLGARRVEVLLAT